MVWLSGIAERFGRIGRRERAARRGRRARRTARCFRTSRLRLEGLEERRLLSGIAPFSNTTPISIPTSGAASPYPSEINVSGLFGTITDVNVTLNGFTHSWPDDVDILLVGPEGQNLILLSDVGSYYSVTGLTLTLDDSAADSLPDTLAQLTSGTYQPTNCYEWDDPFPSPAPAPSTAGTLATFNGTNPNGTWSLYVVDDSNVDGGSISGGWSLEITTAGAPPEINLQGSGINIADGDTSPSAEDGTDFGSADIAGGMVEHIFTIENTGAAALHLTGSPQVQIGGTNADDFEVSVQPSDVAIDAGESLTFVVTFDPSAIGTRTATVSIASDDPDENPYEFAIQGTGTVRHVDFGDFTVDPYDASQDSAGGAAVEDSGATLRITGNHWKKIDYAYTITTNTVLEFDFQSSQQGEIQGIGFDTDGVVSEETIFQLYGTQTWGLQDYRDYANSAPGVQHHAIPVGKFFTGEMSYLVFANDDDASDSAESVFSNIEVYEMALGVEVQGVVETLPVESYGDQDMITRSISADDDFRSMGLVGNAWKQIALSYTVTANTVLEFDFESGQQGEIHGIGLETDEVASPERFFELYGTQTWGLQAYRDYASSPGSVKHYVIPVGKYFQGVISSLVLAADDDALGRAEDVFSNIRIYEPTLEVDVKGESQSLLVTGYGDQDLVTNTLSLVDGFQKLELSGNAWKKVALSDGEQPHYTVTANTVLELDFQSSQQGEIQGIGFDTDEGISAEWFFELYGTQTWGLQAHRDYASSAGDVKHYVIAVGQFFQGDMSYLVLAADDDAGGIAEDVFSNLRLYEAGGGSILAMMEGPASDGQGGTDFGALLGWVDPVLVNGVLGRSGGGLRGEFAAPDEADSSQADLPQVLPSGGSGSGMQTQAVADSPAYDAKSTWLPGTGMNRRVRDRALLELVGPPLQQGREDFGAIAGGPVWRALEELLPGRMGGK